MEIGTVRNARRDPGTGETLYPELELVRLAIPRRVYTNTHMQYVADVAAQVYGRREKVRGFRIVYEPPFLRHFTARFEPLT